jgi:hypothetical protein
MSSCNVQVRNKNEDLLHLQRRVLNNGIVQAASPGFQTKLWKKNYFRSFVFQIERTFSRQKIYACTTPKTILGSQGRSAFFCQISRGTSASNNETCFMSYLRPNFLLFIPLAFPSSSHFRAILYAFQFNNTLDIV